MPIIDMPLEELHQYQGRNPRPADHDAYWARALAELDATPPAPVFAPSHELRAANAECFDLWFTGVRGARIHAKFIRPKRRAGKCPAVLQFHGYTCNAGDWLEKLAYVSEGYVYAALDCRGQGGSSEDLGGVKGNTFRGHIIRGLDDQPDNLLFRHIFLDCAQLARIILALPEVDADKVMAFGGSQGGALTVACAALEPRIRRAAPVYPFLSDYLRVWEMDLAKDAYQEIADYFRWFDPRHERKEEIFRTLGYIDIQHLAPRIKADVLMFTGLMDTVCPPSSQFAAYNKMTCPKRVLIYPDFRHESLPQSSDLIFNFLTGADAAPRPSS
ncbi:MAG: acetylxylan esterase [Verrucomicrobiales bacterium]|jgi:cephalosporin-C deacetylase|nr:acetylxylan esterase [Verrucomicrobiales bacterium]